MTTTAEERRQALSVLLDGPFFLAQAAAPLMQAQGAGVIINILDLSAFEPWPNFIAAQRGQERPAGATWWAGAGTGAGRFRCQRGGAGAGLAPPHYGPQSLAGGRLHAAQTMGVPVRTWPMPWSSWPWRLHHRRDARRGR